MTVTEPTPAAVEIEGDVTIGAPVEKTAVEKTAVRVPWWRKPPAAEPEPEPEAEPEDEGGTGESAEPEAGSGGPAAIEITIGDGSDEDESAESVKAPREPNPRLRWAAFNATAAGAGFTAIWSLAGDPMAGVDYMARLTISVPQLAAAALTVGAAYAGWRGVALIGLHKLPGIFGPGARVAGVIGPALWGQGTAPQVRDVMDALEPWATLLSPLLAAGPFAVACWWGLDRRAAAAHLILPVRWIARIPLATVVVSSLLYAPGVLL